MGSSDWFTRTPDGKELGPLTEAQLRVTLDTSSADGLCVRQGTSEWFPAAFVIQRFRELEQKGIYLRSADKEFGPFVEQRAKEIIETSRGRFIAYRIGADTPWQTIPENLVRLLPPPLPLRNPPPLPLQTPPPLPTNRLAQSAYPYDFVESDNFAPTRSLAGHELPRQMLGWLVLMVLLVVAPSVLVWESALVPRYGFPSITTLWDPSRGQAGQHQSEASGAAQQRRSQSIDKYASELKEVVDRWKMPDSVSDFATSVLATDFNLNDLRRARYQEKQLEDLKSSKESEAFSKMVVSLRKLLDPFLHSNSSPRGLSVLYSADENLGYDGARSIEETERLLRTESSDYQEGDLEGWLPIVKDQLERVGKWSASEKSKIETKRAELDKYRQSSNSFVYRDRLGKPYATKEQRDQAIRDEVLSGRYDNSDGKQSKAIYQSYIQTNLAQAWERDRIEAHEFAVNKTDNERRGQELSTIFEKLTDRLNRVSTAEAELKSLTCSIEEFIKRRNAAFDQASDQVRAHNDKLSATLESLKERARTIALPRSLSELGVKKPTQPAEPILKNHGVRIHDQTYRVEGDCYFLYNKMIRIPAALREHFVVRTHPNQSPNVVTIEGVFEFRGNLSSPYQGGIPLEEYAVPQAFVHFLEKKREYETAMQDYETRMRIFREAEERFQEKAASALALFGALHESLGKGPSQCLDTAEALIEAAATIKRSTPPDFELSVDDKAIVNKSLAELIDWNFVAPTDGASASRETKEATVSEPPTAQPAAVAPGKKNYVKNGDFELDGKPMASPTGWTTRSANKDHSSDSSSWDGQSHVLNHFNSRAYTIYTGQHIQLPNGQYKLSMKVRSSGGQSKAYAVVKLPNGTEKFSPKFRKSDGWVTIEIDKIQISGGACEIGIVSSASASQWLNVDDIKLEQK